MFNTKLNGQCLAQLVYSTYSVELYTALARDSEIGLLHLSCFCSSFGTCASFRLKRSSQLFFFCQVRIFSVFETLPQPSPPPVPRHPLSSSSSSLLLLSFSLPSLPFVQRRSSQTAFVSVSCPGPPCRLVPFAGSLQCSRVLRLIKDQKHRRYCRCLSEYMSELMLEEEYIIARLSRFM